MKNLKEIQKEITKAKKAIESLPEVHELAPESWKNELRQEAEDMRCGGMFNFSPRKAGQSYNAMYAESRGELTLSKLPAVLRRMTEAGFGESDMWHHTGQFKGHMNETNFYAGCDFDLSGYEHYLLNKKTIDAKKEADAQAGDADRIAKANAKINWLNENCEYIIRSTDRLFVEEKREMNGKYGWFDSSRKNYNLPEYFTGWKLRENAKQEEYFKIVA
jgi:hypothetical protein